MDHFHYTPEQIGDLTDRQITELAFHERTKEGNIEPVRKTSGMDNPLFALSKLQGICNLDPSQVEELKEQLRKRQPEE